MLHIPAAWVPRALYISPWSSVRMGVRTQARYTRTTNQENCILKQDETSPLRVLATIFVFRLQGGIFLTAFS